MMQITLPSLLERREDIPLLIQYLLAHYSHRFPKQVTGIDQKAREVLVVRRQGGVMRLADHLDPGSSGKEI